MRQLCFCNMGEKARGSPDKGDQPPAHLFRVFGISGQVFAQKRFFAADPPDDDRRICEEDQKACAGAQDQRHAQKEENGRAVHGMAHNSI